MNIYREIGLIFDLEQAQPKSWGEWDTIGWSKEAYYKQNIIQI